MEMHRVLRAEGGGEGEEGSRDDHTVLSAEPGAQLSQRDPRRPTRRDPLR